MSHRSPLSPKVRDRRPPIDAMMGSGSGFLAFYQLPTLVGVTACMGLAQDLLLPGYSPCCYSPPEPS